MTENSLSRPAETGMARVRNYMLSPEVKERFSEMMGANGIYYLNQVLILVANSEDLQKCDPKSILISAMRAASLRLSVDPGQGQAWIIPYKGKASFQFGYKGIYELAMRTNLYRFINVATIYEGETITENRLTGMHNIEGKRASNKVIGYMLYFQLVNGFEKTYYMTLEEIDAHAKRYSQAYNSPRSKWNDPYERAKMEKKTVLVNGLRKWGRFNQNDLDTIAQIEEEQGWVEAGVLPDETDVTTPTDAPAKTEAELMAGLGYEPEDKPAAQAEAPAQPTEPVTPQPEPLRYSPDHLKTRIAEIAKTTTGQASNGKRGLVATTLEAALSYTADPKASRHQVLHYLTGHASIRDIPDNVILALYAWLKPDQDTGGEWRADEMSIREAVAALNAAQPAQDTLL